MIIKCISNNISDLPKNLGKFAFGQDAQGTVDLTVDKQYAVYGIRKNKFGKFFLVLTDTFHTTTPWWMPERFFETVDADTPEYWQKKTHGIFSKAWTYTDPEYFPAELEIEDGTDKGVEVFDNMIQKMKEV